MEEYTEKEIEILGKYIRVKVRPQEDGTEIIDDPASVQAIKDVFIREQEKQKMVGASTVAIAIIFLIALVISFLGGA